MLTLRDMDAETRASALWGMSELHNLQPGGEFKHQITSYTGLPWAPLGWIGDSESKKECGWTLPKT